LIFQAALDEGFAADFFVTPRLLRILSERLSTPSGQFLQTEILHETVKQLAYKIKDAKGHPRFAFFLGAGASRQSGVITAGEMIVQFKNRLIAGLCPDTVLTAEDKHKWLIEQEWYPDVNTEYSGLFERLEPKEYGRRAYIEQIIEGREPSFGYVVLANLIASSYINVILTTNFDDLVYSACANYTGFRPIVYAHGLLASEMRIGAKQPKILKLHGDYLYSTLINTQKDLRDDLNMETQVASVLSEYGLIVVGYGGGDESVINILKKISPKNDLYWCILAGSRINQSVQALLEEKEGCVIEIDGFDEMMNEIRRIVGFDVGRMFGSILERQDSIIEKIKEFAFKYSVDILAEIVEALTEEQKMADQGAQKRIDNLRCLDLFTQARNARRGGEHKRAEELYREVIKINREYKLVQNDLGIVLEDMDRPADAEEAYRKEIDFNNEDSNAYSNLMKLLRSQDRNPEALEVGEKALRRKATSFETFISLVAVHMVLGNSSEAAIYAAETLKILEPDAWYHLASLDCVLGNTESAIENLRRAKSEAEKPEDFDRLYAKKDLDFVSIRDDPRFKEIIGDEAAQPVG
jgi:tetratricopeptide (TPR) repeat protein